MKIIIIAMLIISIAGAAHWGNQWTWEDEESFASAGSARNTEIHEFHQKYGSMNLDLLLRPTSTGSKRKRLEFSAEDWLLQSRTLKSRSPSSDQLQKRGKSILSFRWANISGEPIPAAAWAEGEQGDQIGVPGEAKDDPKILPDATYFQLWHPNSYFFQLRDCALGGANTSSPWGRDHLETGSVTGSTTTV